MKRDFTVFIPQIFSLEIFCLFFLAGRLYCGEFLTLTMLIFILAAYLKLRGHEESVVGSGNSTFCKKADYKNEKSLKIKVFFLYFTLKTEKRIPFLKFHTLL